MAPGGGSISAYVGALGASLGSMVANLGANKRGWENKLDFFSDVAVKAQEVKDHLLYLVDEDTRSFNAIIDAIRMPKDSEQERSVRKLAIEKASQYAAEIPFEVMQTANQSFDLLDQMIENGNKASITDTGVGVLCTETAIRGAFMNVLVNTKDLEDRSFAQDLESKARKLMDGAQKRASELRLKVESQLA